MMCREQSSYAPSQWEASLQCNDVSHWLDAYLDWSLDVPWFIILTSVEGNATKTTETFNVLNQQSPLVCWSGPSAGRTVNVVNVCRKLTREKPKPKFLRPEWCVAMFYLKCIARQIVGEWYIHVRLSNCLATYYNRCLQSYEYNPW